MLVILYVTRVQEWYRDVGRTYCHTKRCSKITNKGF